MTRTDAENLVYTTGNADATLLGYLGNGKFYNSINRPDNAAKPCMAMQFVPFGTNGQNFTAQEFLVRFNLYLDNNGTNRQPDRDLAGVVEARLNTLFSRKTLSDSNGRVQLDGEQPANIFTPDLDETVYQFTFNATVL